MASARQRRAAEDQPGGGPAIPATTSEQVESLGISLGPALHDACGGRLGHIEWFVSPWQHSGAATGRTWWRLPSGAVVPAIVKAPVGYREWYWSTHLGGCNPMQWDDPQNKASPVPRVLSSGIELGGYDIAWLVMERILGESVAQRMGSSALERLFASAAALHRAAADIKAPTPDDRADPPAWHRLVERARSACEDNPQLPGQQAWLTQLDRVARVLDRVIEVWEGRPTATWCHGDLHPGNAVLRDQGSGDAVLLDLGLIHAGHWVEDALYLERLYWGRPEVLEGICPVSCLGAQRARLGLAIGDDDATYANARRLLMAATSPGFLAQEGDPRYLAAALERLAGLVGLFEI